MIAWKLAKGYESKYKVSTHCGIKTLDGKAVALSKVGDDIVFKSGSTKLSAVKIAKDTFGEKYAFIPETV